MTIDLYSSAGAKKGTLELPEALFDAHINKGLIHQAVMLQQGNRRKAIAHAKNRHEVSGSTKKLYGQKHTGNARRGSIRSPLMRGGGKAFGPRKDRNFTRDMPRAMRHAALAACLSLQAKQKSILGLEGYEGAIKTKVFVDLVKKLPVELGRRLLFVLPEKHEGMSKSARNVPGIKTILVNYLNPEDVMGAKSIIFVGGSIEKAVEIFTGKTDRSSKVVKMDKEEEGETAPKVAKTPKAPKKTVAKKAATKKSSPKKPA